MNGHTHTLVDALRRLDKQGVKITKERKLIIPLNRLGNKLWGLVDYLITTKAALGWQFAGSQ